MSSKLCSWRQSTGSLPILESMPSPGRDFTRNRKMGFHDTLMMLLTMEADRIKEELYRYFGRTTDAPSKAAFYRQRRKLTGDAPANLLYTFNSRLQKNLYNGKYQFIACDGSAADIFRNPDDPDTFFEPNGKSTRGFNQVYINTFYSILDRRFANLVVQPARKRNEYAAFCGMVGRERWATHHIFRRYGLRFLQ